MKKILSSLIVLMLFVSSFMTFNISAEKAEIVNVSAFSYAVNEEAETNEITGFGRSKQDIVYLPERNGNDVMSGIAPGAFKDETEITEVMTTITLTYIGAEAFAGCTSLTRVEFFQNIKEIGEDAFKDCPVTFYVPEESPAIDYAIANDIPYEIITHASYTLTYDPNAGEYADIEYKTPPEEPYTTAKKKTMETSEVTVSYPLPDKVGYTFYGWEDEEGNEYKNATTIKMYRKDVTLTPVFRKIYWLNFHAEDFANTPEILANITGSTSRYYDKEEGMTLELQASNAFSCKGYQLLGWYCAENGIEYAPGASFTMMSSDVHFYAIWVPQTYNYTFKANNGTTSSVKSVATYGQPFIIPECEFTYSGHKFAGWKFGSTDTVYQPGDSYEVVALVSGRTPPAFSALWEEVTVPAADYGDVDLDGKFGDITDVVLLGKHLSGHITLPTDSVNFTNSNCYLIEEGMELVNVDDLKAMIDYMLGSIPSLPVY